MSTRTHVFEAGDDTLNAGGSPAVRAAISAYWTQVFGCPEEFSISAVAERSVGRTDGLIPSTHAYRPGPPHAHNSILRRIVRLRPHTAQSPQTRDSAPRLQTVAVVPIAEINGAAKRALKAALAIQADEVIAVHVCDRRRRSATRRFEQEWDDWNPNITMVFLDGREDSVATPILEYVQRTYTRTQIFVFITHNHRIHPSDNGITHHHANQLESTFRHEPNIVICRSVFHQGDFSSYDLPMVAEEQIQKSADEAEAGYDVEELKRRGRGRLAPRTTIRGRRHRDS